MKSWKHWFMVHNLMWNRHMCMKPIKGPFMPCSEGLFKSKPKRKKRG